MFEYEFIEARGEGHVQNARRRVPGHTKPVRRAAWLKEKCSDVCLFFFSAPKNFEHPFQYMDRHIFTVMDMQRRFVPDRAQYID